MVVQGEYGVNRPWYWPFIAPFEKWRERNPGLRADIETGMESTQSLGRSKLTIEPTASTLPPSRDAEAALVIANASKAFGTKAAVRNVCLAVYQGEIFALLGPNGAGKTTLINCILGLYKFTSGTAYISGHSILAHPQRVYNSIGICPQHEILWPDLTVEEHLLFYCRLKGTEIKSEKEVVSKCLEEVELLGERGKRTAELSGGQKRRLCVAIALVGRPAVVFLDEPTTGIIRNGSCF